MKAQEAREKGFILKTDKNEKPSHFVSEDVYHFTCTLQSFFKSVHNKKIADHVKEESLSENGIKPS